MNIRYIIGKIMLKLPIIRYNQFVYSLLGVKCVQKGNKYFIGNPRVIGDYSIICMHENSEIERCCFLLAKDRIEIGENTTLAYGVSIITGADPNGPKNKLSKLYPPLHASVVIGNDCWIGANAIILPGVTIGDCVMVAAGSVVNKDVPSNVLVAGSSAVIKKHLEV